MPADSPSKLEPGAGAEAELREVVVPDLLRQLLADHHRAGVGRLREHPGRRELHAGVLVGVLEGLPVGGRVLVRHLPRAQRVGDAGLEGGGHRDDLARSSRARTRRRWRATRGGRPRWRRGRSGRPTPSRPGRGSRRSARPSRPAHRSPTRSRRPAGRRASCAFHCRSRSRVVRTSLPGCAGTCSRAPPGISWPPAPALVAVGAVDAGQLVVEGPLEPGEPLAVAVEEPDDVAGDGAGRVDALVASGPPRRR